MKYVSPIYEVETIETEDIMSASKALADAENLGIDVTGSTSSLSSVTLTDGDGKPVETGATGVSIGINFGSLFG